ncbi:MAG: hypothetical protein R6U37_01045 [Dehalococcoidia bacterium]
MYQSDNIEIHYTFKLPDATEENFKIILDARTLKLLNQVPESPPEWARLDFHQCPNCTLSADKHGYCPLIMSLLDIVSRFEKVISYDELDIEVITGERRISNHTSAQRGISSLMGLIIATCGCPHTLFFRAMARFHLPFASDAETVYRAASTYLLMQYFRLKEGHKFDEQLEGLNRIYENIHTVNSAVAERLRAATETDSSVNALIILDTYTMFVPIGIETSLEEVRYLFEPYLNEINP